MTIEVESKRKNLNTVRMTNYTPQYSSTKSVGQRMWQLEDELRRMEPDRLILFMRGEKPVMLKKFPFNKHPMYKECKVKKTWTYIPTWRINDKGIDILTNKEPQKDITGSYITDEWIEFAADLIAGKILDKDRKIDDWHKYLADEEKCMFEHNKKAAELKENKSEVPSDKISASDQSFEKKEGLLQTEIDNVLSENGYDPSVDYSDFENTNDDMSDPFAVDAVEAGGDIESDVQTDHVKYSMQSNGGNENVPSLMSGSIPMPSVNVLKAPKETRQYEEHDTKYDSYGLQYAGNPNPGINTEKMVVRGMAEKSVCHKDGSVSYKADSSVKKTFDKSNISGSEFMELLLANQKYHKKD